MTRNDFIINGLNDSIGFLYSYTIDLENQVQALTNELNEMKQLLANNNLENQMGKIIYEGLITDPNDPVYKRGWTITIPYHTNKKKKDKKK